MVGGRTYRVLALVMALVGCGSSSAPDDGAEGGAGSSSGGSSAGGSFSGGGGAGAQAGVSGSGESGAGSGGSVGTSGGSGGSADGGSMTSGSAGSGSPGAGSSGIGPNEAEACIAYAAASCNRRAACTSSTSGTGYGCAYSCPDVVFAPGSTRTAELLFECATAFETLACEDLEAGVYPPCVTPGTKKIGEPCRFSAQCESLECNVDDAESCGTCVRGVGENEDCTSPDTECRGSYQCIEGICQVPTYVYKELGEPCTSEYDCDSEAYCDGVCVSFPGENESCEMVEECLYGFYCAAADHVCRPEPALSEPCGSAAGTTYPSCTSGLACNTATADGTGVCIETVVVDAGGSCPAPAWFCTTGTRCSCTDDSCAEKICATERLLGEPCGDGANVCALPLECTAGACVAPSYQGLYEEVCGP